MQVKRWMPTKRSGSMSERLVSPLGDVKVMAFKPTVENLVSGMKERVYYIDAAGTQPPRCVYARYGSPAVGAWAALPVALPKLLGQVVDDIGPCTRETMREYISHRTGSKKRVYEAARVNLIGKSRPLTELASLSFFVKREATVWGKAQVPRIISPRAPEFNLLLGRYIHPVEKKIFKSMGDMWFGGDTVIAKGLTQEEKAELIVSQLAKHGACVGLDASRFDQSIKGQLLTIEHAIYNGLYPGDRLLPALLRQQLSNAGVGRCRDGHVTAKIGAMRCSGDVNTSLGNCIISCILAKLFFLEHGVEGSVLIDGDDTLFFLHESQLSLLAAIPAWYEKWGLRMVVERPAFKPEQVEFCQSRPVCLGGNWVLCRNPAKAFNTDGFLVVPEGLDRRLEHLRAVGLCGLSMAAGVPLFQAFYHSLVAEGKTGKFDINLLGGMGYQHRIQVRAGHLARCKPITAEARQSFWQAFGVAPGEQIALEFAMANVDWSRRLDDYCVPTHNLVGWLFERTAKLGSGYTFE